MAVLLTKSRFLTLDQEKSVFFRLKKMFFLLFYVVETPEDVAKKAARIWSIFYCRVWPVGKKWGTFWGGGRGEFFGCLQPPSPTLPPSKWGVKWKLHAQSPPSSSSSPSAEDLFFYGVLTTKWEYFFPQPYPTSPKKDFFTLKKGVFCLIDVKLSTIWKSNCDKSWAGRKGGG